MGLALVVAGATVWLAAPWAGAQEVKHRPSHPLTTPAPVAPVDPAGTTNVTIVDSAYEPAAVTIEEGDTVTWTHQGSATHTVSSDDGSMFDSGFLNNGQQFSFTFNDAGTVTYHCNVHPFMHGTVTVNAAATTTVPATTQPPTSQPTGSTTPGSADAPTSGGDAGTNTTAGAASATTTAASPELANSGIPATAMVFAGLALIAVGASLLRLESKR